MGGDAAAAVGVLYFALVVLSFAWIAAPPERGPAFLRVSAALRIVLAAALVSAAFIPLVYLLGRDSAFYTMMKNQAELVVSVYRSMTASDPVEASFQDSRVTADFVLNTMIFIALRGGALASTALFLFINRQAAVLVSWFFRRGIGKESLGAFHARPALIWFFSFSLLAILAGAFFDKAFLEIPGWNMLVFCAILYLIQGGGIVLYFLTRPGVPLLLRSLANVLIVFIMLSPIVNGIALGALTLLGIAENWVPFRVPRQQGPTSTPEV
jgi:hypothetical protein